MKKLITELRERGVVRVAGLYIAITWLILQISDVVFPAFEIPDSVVRYIVYAAVAGSPLVLIFTWFYEFTSEGIRTETEVRESGAKRAGSGYLSILTIVALVLALGVSLTVNYQQASDAPQEAQPLLSVLVADFQNRTGEPVFDGALETATAAGMEGASFIGLYPRAMASDLAENTGGDKRLSGDSARLVSRNAGIDGVLLGTIDKAGSGYELTLSLFDPVADDTTAEADALAASRSEVLLAVGILTTEIREALGDSSLDESDPAFTPNFTFASLDAVHNFATAQAFNETNQDAQAAEHYKKAVGEDPDFGRAYAGWAVSEFKLGRTDKSQELWEKALALVGGMTERQRYRTLGAYHLMVSADYALAAENYRLLVEKYPLDGPGWNDLRRAYVQDRNFVQALEASARLMEIYPGNSTFLSDYPTFAMYAGDFAEAKIKAEELLTQEPNNLPLYLPVAMADLAEGKADDARKVYQRVSQLGDPARSLAVAGEADIALFTGEYALAAKLLSEGIIADATTNNSQGAAHKGIYLAYAEVAQGNSDAALEVLDKALQSTSDLSHLLPAASLLIQLGQDERAQEIAAGLDSGLASTSRAAADYLNGEIALQRQDAVAAVDAFNESLELTDSWLVRLALGRAFSAAGYHVEALGEFELCEDRLGEATSLFLNDIPSFQYSASLYYWLGRTKMQLGMRKEARADLGRYLSLRVDSDTSHITEDARALLASLPE